MIPFIAKSKRFRNAPFRRIRDLRNSAAGGLISRLLLDAVDFSDAQSVAAQTINEIIKTEFLGSSNNIAPVGYSTFEDLTRSFLSSGCNVGFDSSNPTYGQYELIIQPSSSTWYVVLGASSDFNVELKPGVINKLSLYIRSTINGLSISISIFSNDGVTTTQNTVTSVQPSTSKTRHELEFDLTSAPLSDDYRAYIQIHKELEGVWIGESIYIDGVQLEEIALSGDSASDYNRPGMYLVDDYIATRVVEKGEWEAVIFTDEIIKKSVRGYVDQIYFTDTLIASKASYLKVAVLSDGFDIGDYKLGNQFKYKHDAIGEFDESAFAYIRGSKIVLDDYLALTDYELHSVLLNGTVILIDLFNLLDQKIKNSKKLLSDTIDDFEDTTAISSTGTTFNFNIKDVIVRIYNWPILRKHRGFNVN